MTVFVTDQNMLAIVNKIKEGSLKRSGMNDNTDIKLTQRRAAMMAQTTTNVVDEMIEAVAMKI